MSRPLRLEYPHTFYHIISRGHRQENIFNCDKDKVKFIEKLKETIFDLPKIKDDIKDEKYKTLFILSTQEDLELI